MKNRYLHRVTLVLLFVMISNLSGWHISLAQNAEPSILQHTGVNFAIADFEKCVPDSVYGTEKLVPDDFTYYLDKGINTFRIPFCWERLLPPQSNGLPAADFEQDEWVALIEIVSYVTAQGATVILDPHNYARYQDRVLARDAEMDIAINVPISAFADFWSKLADEFKENERVVFGLMNEPYDMDSYVWKDAADAAISAIRNTGATNLILVPGNGWTGAHSWLQNWYSLSKDVSNAELMLTINDPGDNYAFEVHQYFDFDSSGTNYGEGSCTENPSGVQRLIAFTSWLREHNQRGFLGEFGVSPTTVCLSALNDMLDYIAVNDDVWLGWTYWAGGPEWDNYSFDVEPVNGQDRPQMAVLESHLVTIAPNADLVLESFEAQTGQLDVPDFADSGALTFQPDPLHATDGDYAGRMTFQHDSGTHSRAVYKIQPESSLDFSGYDQLEFDIWKSYHAMEINIAVLSGDGWLWAESAHQVLDDGPNTVIVNLDGLNPAELNNVKQLLVFLYLSESGEGDAYIDNLRLTTD